MTSSKIEMPGEVKADPAALMASLHLLPSPTPNLEIKYTKQRDNTPSSALGLLKSCRDLGTRRGLAPACRAALTVAVNGSFPNRICRCLLVGFSASRLLRGRRRHRFHSSKG
ncbi:hypothetical protein J1605_004030 [Eschrichtius robustus]|uniref:Uncharacterized protein n=1 Tax=Eschrichtius robustus TaxID=9764 RepID=A0AB34HPN1_ESCRO|nr:hypothetical protein J1605_004030 [Eschrichtius robustus]